jgi:hypothetical protein
MSAAMNPDSVPSKTGIRRPPKVTSTESGKAGEEIQQVLVYLKGEGFGPQLNEENKRPKIDIDLTVIPEVRPPGEQPAEPEENADDDELESFARKLKVWTVKMEAYEKGTESLRRARREHDRQSEALEKWQTSHDKAVGVFSTFFDPHKFKQVSNHKTFKDEPTLYNAVTLIKELYTTADKSG